MMRMLGLGRWSRFVGYVWILLFCFVLQAHALDTPLQITSWPASTSANPGAAATFSLTATESPINSPLTVQWGYTANSQWSPFGTPGSSSQCTTSPCSSTFTTPPVGSAPFVTGLEVVALVTDSLGNSVSTVTPAILTVNAAPTITAQPQSLTVTANGANTASFSVTATGTPTPTYQWRYSSNGGTSWLNFGSGTGTTSASMTTNPVPIFANGWLFDVVVTNTAGSVTSNSATLTVNEAPIISSGPANQTAAQGSPATFSVVATGVPAVSYQWQYNSGSGWMNWGSGTGTTSASMTTNPAPAVADGWQFQVLVSNGVSPAATGGPVTLYVVKPPTVSAISPSSANSIEGASVTFNATATLPSQLSSGTLTCQWYHQVGSGTPIALGTSCSSQTISPVAATDAGSYYMVATDTVGSVTAMAQSSNSATLTVTPGHWVPAPTTPTGANNLSGPETFMRSVLLPSGDVMVIGDASTTINIFTPAANSGAGAWSTSAAGLTGVVRRPTTTLLPTGQVLIAGGINPSTTVEQSAAYLYSEASGGTVTTTGSLGTARDSHTAALLPTGKVLVAGGYNGVVLNSAELYDPASGTWSSTGSMGSARYRAAATLLQNGKVLITGGQSTVSPLSAMNTAVIYNPSTGVWTPSNSIMTTARYFHTSTLLPGGQVLITGGINTAGVTLNTAEIYDPAADTFTALTSSFPTMIAARNQHTATLLASGKVLLAGGANATELSTSEYFDPTGGQSVSSPETTAQIVVNGSFLQTASLITARDRSTAWLLQSGTPLVAGGTGAGDVSISTAEKFLDESGITPTVPTVTVTSSTGVAALQTGITATCSAPGADSNSTYAWTVTNGAITAGGGTSSITFTAGSATPITLYCLVTSSLSIPSLGSATVPVNLPPQIADSGQPVGETVVQGTSASFTVTATSQNSSGTLSYQWYYGTGTTNPVGGNSSILLITSAQDANAGNYYVVVTNTIGSSTTTTASNPATLVVNLLPSVGITTASPYSVTQGNTAALTASATNPNASGTLTYQWYYGTGTMNPVGVNSSTLTLTNVQPAAAGLYYVVVNNALGGTNAASASSNAVQLIVDTLPVVTLVNGSQTVTANGANTASFSATATGVPTPTYQWQYSSNSGASWLSFGSGTGTATLSMTTNPVPAFANGWLFRLAATNSFGTGYSANATLTVDSLPVVTLVNGSQTVIANGTNTASFSASLTSGYPAPTYQWQYNSGSGWLNFGAGTGTTTLSMTTNPMPLDDNGWQFRLAATNSAGTGYSAAATLTVETLPVVTLVNGTQTVIANGANTASFSATATGVPAPTYQWQYSSNSGASWLSFGSGTGTTTLSMTTNPVPAFANGWLFRLAATNSVGTGYSAAATLYVNETPTLSQLQNVTVAQGGSAAFTVTPTTTDGVVSYQWYKVGGGSPDTLLTSTGDFNITSGSTSSTLTVSPALLGDAGQYYVIVTDAVDSSNLPKTSNTASLTVTAGAWTNVGSQSSARYEAMSLMLPNGNFWVAGGQNDSGLLNDDAVYTSTDATHGTWASSGSNVFVAGPHLDGTATLLPSGNVLIVGGSDGQDGKQGVEIYNSGTGTYTASNVQSIAQPTTRHVAALLSNGTVLIAGGTNGWSDTYYNNAYIYDPAADTLTPVPTDSTHTLGTARAGSFAVTLSNGKVLIVGGQDVNGVDNAADLYTPNATSPSAGTFAAIAGGMTSPRLYHTATLLSNGKVLIAGGTNGSSVLNTMEIFDPAGNSGAGSFTALGTMSTQRLAHSAVLLANGKVLIFGGTNDGTTVLNSAEVIDPNYASDSGTLTIPATSTNFTRELDSATLLPNGTVLAAGGYSGSASLATAEVWGALEGYSAAPTAPNATITVTTSGGNQITVPSEADLTPTSTNTASVPLDSTASYYWKISNGSITAGQNTDQITFTSGASGSMTIPVLITDIYGFSAVGEAIPTILVPPSGLSLTPSRSSSSGSPLTSPASITLNAQYTGGTTAFISSSTGGSDIPVTSNNFTTSTLSLNQTTTFTLTVLNGVGGSVTSQVTVYVTSTLPSISSQPSSVAACLNGNATFDVVSSSSAGSLTSYGWYDGATLVGSGTVSGSGPYTYQLTLSGLTAASNGNYTLHMTDPAGTTISSPATLKVGNSITQQPQSVTISPSQTATFSVAVSNVDAVSYQWHWIHSSSDTTVGTNSSIYTTPAVTSANNGDQYYVVVADTGGCGQTALTSSSATLTVNSNYTDVPPTITVQPTGQTATVGGGAIFSATAVGPGSLSYEWYRIPYGQTVGQAYAVCGSGGGTGVACTLTVSSSSATNEGDKYYLKVVNGYGQTVSSSAQLAVVPGVLITSQPQTQYVGVGDTAVYSVGATCNGCTLNYQWYVIPLGSTSASPVSGATSSTLEITDALSSQSGSVYYVVVGSNGNSQSVTSLSAGLFVGSLGAVNDECSGGGWQLNGNASTFSGTIDGSGTICGIQLVPNSYGASSSIFWPTPISTAKFSASFNVGIYANTFPADGFTMVLADPTKGASKYSTGASGSGLGAQGISGFVLGFDTYYNSGLDPCQPPYLGVGRGESALWENPWTSTNCYLPNGSSTYYGNNGVYTNSSHNYVVTVDNGSMSVSMDGNQVFSGAVTMPPVAYLGFTGSTGGAKEQVVISNMVVTLSADTTPTLLSIAVTPAAQYVTSGLTQQFTATGTYSDNTTQNITNTVTWTESTSGAVATISNTSGTQGLATAVAPGSSTITATLGTVSGTATLNAAALPTASLAASTSTPLYGATNVTVTPTFGGGTISAIVGTSQGGSNISSSPTSGTAIGVQTGGFTVGTTYWVRATNAAGTFVDVSVTVTPQTVSVGSITSNLSVASYATVSATPTFSSIVSGGALGTVAWSVSGTGCGSIGSTSGIWSVPGTVPGGACTITATSNDNATKTSTTSVTVVAAPTASLAASTTSPLYGATNVTITPSFTGATYNLSAIGFGQYDLCHNCTATSAIAVEAGGYTTATTYYMQATNAAGSTVNASTVTITPQTVSVGSITSTLSVPAYATVSTTPTFSATVSGGALGTVAWSISGTNCGSIGATTGLWTVPATPSTGACTITATSNDNATKTATTSVTVVAAPVTPSITIPSYVTASTGGYTATISNTSTPTSTYTWSITNGSLSGTPTGPTGTFTAGSSGSVQLHATATNAAGATGSQGNSNSATVVAPPPDTPTVTVTSSATVVTAGTVDAYTTGNTASITDVSGSSGTDTYSWSVSGGSSITAGQGTLSITFTAGASGNAAPTCTITNAAGLAGAPGSASTPINTLSSVSVTPKNMYLAEIATQQYVLTSTYSDTSTANIANGATWSESDADSGAVASIGSSSGLATAGSVTGVATITATINSTPYTTNLMVGAWTASAESMVGNTYQALPMMELNNGSHNILWLAGGRNAENDTWIGDNIDVLPYVSTNPWTNTLTLYASPGNPPYNVLRYAHLNGTATLVPSGQVIIAGGDNLISGIEETPQTTIEIYSPTVPAFTVSSAVLPLATTGQVAALLTNGPNAGDVLIAGGWNDSSTFYTNASLYNPTGSAINGLAADHRAISSASLGTGRYGSTATTLNDHRILIVGGVDPVGSVHADNAVDIYDDLYNSSLDTNSTPYANSVAYPTGQYTLSNGSSDTGDVFASAICGPLTTGNACLNTARVDHTATVLPSGKVLIAGGTNAAGTTALTSLEIFDPTLNAGAGGFISLGNLHTARFNHSAVPLENNMVLIFGGTDSSGNSLNSAEVVDANWVADGWPSSSVAVASLNINRALAASILLPDGTSVLATGGNIGTVSVPVDAGHNGTATTEVFSPAGPCGSPTVSLWISGDEVSTSSTVGEYIENPANQTFTATLSGSETGVTWTSSGGGTYGANTCTGLSCAFEDTGTSTNLSNVTAHWGSSCSASSAWIRVLYD
jgi:hypothetical protein